MGFDWALPLPSECGQMKHFTNSQPTLIPTGNRKEEVIYPMESIALKKKGPRKPNSVSSYQILIFTIIIIRHNGKFFSLPCWWFKKWKGGKVKIRMGYAKKEGRKRDRAREWGGGGKDKRLFHSQLEKHQKHKEMIFKRMLWSTYFIRTWWGKHKSRSPKTQSLSLSWVPLTLRPRLKIYICKSFR